MTAPLCLKSGQGPRMVPARITEADEPDTREQGGRRGHVRVNFPCAGHFS